MTGILRIVRCVCGFLFALQVVHLIGAALQLLNSEEISMGAFVGLAFLKVIALVVFGFLFFWIRNFINHNHFKRHGVKHPSLAGNKWAL